TIRWVIVLEMRDALADTPTDASRKVGAPPVIMEHSIEIDSIKKTTGNPTDRGSHLQSKRPPSEQRRVDRIEAFRAADDDRTLLIFELLIGTGQRIGDVLAMQWGHITPDGVSVVQEKTDAHVTIPLSDHLAAVIAAA